MVGLAFPCQFFLLYPRYVDSNRAARKSFLHVRPVRPYLYAVEIPYAMDLTVPSGTCTCTRSKSPTALYLRDTCTAACRPTAVDIDVPFLYNPGFAIYAVGDFDRVQVLCDFDRNTCPRSRGFRGRTGTVLKHVYAVGDFDSVHVHVPESTLRSMP